MPPSPTKMASEKLFVILILFFGLIMAFLLASGIDSVPADQLVVARDEALAEFDSIELDLSVVDNILFKQLKVFGIIPVSPGVTGRDNPFAPF